MKNQTNNTVPPVPLARLVRLVVGSRRGKPGQLQAEIAEALIPIMLKHRKAFGTLDQVAGCASYAASESIRVALHGSLPNTMMSHGEDGSRQNL